RKFKMVPGAMHPEPFCLQSDHRITILWYQKALLKLKNETLIILQQKIRGVNVHIYGFTHNKQAGENADSCRSGRVAV
ncbi:hypothetical protein, partial [Hungatella hathewayi]|uniref:hypothetical protein n=1 Tax=Hungatella hathewayi TaxID=154046 RepID=UPI001A9A4811